MAHQNIYRHYVRLNPYLEQETSYFPTSSQLVAVVRAQCPASSGKTPVIIGGNSVFNGSGQKGEQLWSRVLQTELGDSYHVVNFAAPGAGVVDNGGVIFEALAQEYPHALFVTNTEPGYYKPANQSSYGYLFWDAYYKGLLPREADAVAQNTHGKETADQREFRLSYRLNSRLYFDDLWTGVAYDYVSTIWTSWLQSHSFYPRSRLPDWYDKRPPREAGESAFEKLLPGHLEGLRRRLPVAADRFQRNSDGSLSQTAESLSNDQRQIAELLPASLHPRSLIVLTPHNPWFLARLTGAEQSRVSISFQNAATLLTRAGFHVLALHDRGFEPSDFGDTVHLSPAGGRRLAHLVADSIRGMDTQPGMAAAR